MASCRCFRKPRRSTGTARRRSPFWAIRRSDGSSSSRGPGVPDLPESGGSDPAVERLAAGVRGDLSPGLARGDRDELALCRAAEQHGVLSLIAEHVASSTMPRAWAVTLGQRARRAAASDLVREGELRTIVAAL